MAEERSKPGFRATPQNPLLGATSRGIRKARETLDYVPLPDLLGGGLGSLLMGDAPEEIERWSYGSSPFYSTEYGTPAMIGRMRPERVGPMVDTVGLPVAEAYGLAKLTGKGLKAAGRKVAGAAEKPVEQGRRKFIKDAGLAAAGATVARTTPDILDNLATKAVDEPLAARIAARMAARLTPAQYYRKLAGAKVLQDIAFNKALKEYPEFDPSKYPDTADLETVFDNYVSAKYDSAAKAAAAVRDEAMKDTPFGYYSADELDTMMYGNDADYVRELMRQDILPESHTWVAHAGKKHGIEGFETVADRIARTGEYVDPSSGNRAFLDESGNVVWTNGLRDGKGNLITNRYQHWLGKDAYEIDALREAGMYDESTRSVKPEASRLGQPRNPYSSFTDDGDPTPWDTDELGNPIDELGNRTDVYKSGGSIENTTHGLGRLI